MIYTLHDVANAYSNFAFVDEPKIDIIILLLLLRTENSKFLTFESDGNGYFD